jgi:hypothetical protein
MDGQARRTSYILVLREPFSVLYHKKTKWYCEAVTKNKIYGNEKLLITKDVGRWKEKSGWVVRCCCAAGPPKAMTARAREEEKRSQRKSG